MTLWGGSRDEFGKLYFQPTMLAGMSADSEINQEEVFGPVLTIAGQTFDSDEEVINIANSTLWLSSNSLYAIGRSGNAHFIIGYRRYRMGQLLLRPRTVGAIWR